MSCCDRHRASDSIDYSSDVEKVRGMEHDPVADAVSVLRPRGICSGIGAFSSPFGVRDQSADAVHFHVVMSGTGLAGDGSGSLLQVRVGQAIVGIGTPIVLMDRPGRKVVDLAHITQHAPGSWIFRIGTAEPTLEVYCGSIELIPGATPLLLQALKGMYTIGEGTSVDDLTLTSLHSLLANEARQGSSSVLERLAEAWFSTLLRSLLPRAGTLYGLASTDRAICAALTAVRRDATADWTVEKLASLAGLSRSRFAERFTAAVGEPPLTHVARWRIQAGLAAEAAGATRNDAARIAGYSCASAFRRALQRWGVASPA
jgi:AraC-like DNA-binding protein